MTNLKSQYRRLFDGRSSSDDSKLLKEEHASVSELPEAWIKSNKDEYESAIRRITDTAWEQLSDLSFGSWAEGSTNEYPSDVEEIYLMNKIMKRVATEFE